MQQFNSQNYHQTLDVTRMITDLRKKNRRHQLWHGLLTGALALAVIASGFIIGNVTAHNHQLKSQLTTQGAPQSYTAPTAPDEDSPDNANHDTTTAVMAPATAIRHEETLMPMPKLK